MRARPLGLGLQGQGPNRRRLLWSNDQGGEHIRKRRAEIRQVGAGKANASEPLMRCRKLQMSSKPSFNVGFGTKSGGRPVYCPGGDRHKGGASPAQALVRNVGTFAPMLRETSEWRTHEGVEYRCGTKGRTGW